MIALTKLSSAFDGLRDDGMSSIDDLVPQLYEQLRVIAHRELGRRPAGGTLATTELVHEAYLKLAAGNAARAQDQPHLLALVSVVMRHVLVDRAKARGRAKRGGACGRVTLEEDRIAVEDQSEALLQLDDALSWLAGLQPRLARVVECRFFGGLSEEEIAAALGVTTRTVQRDWAKARMLLRRALEQ